MEGCQCNMWGEPMLPRNAIPVLSVKVFYHSNENRVQRTGRNNVLKKKLEARRKGKGGTVSSFVSVVSSQKSLLFDY